MNKVVLSIVSKRKNIDLFTFRNISDYYWNLKQVELFCKTQKEFTKYNENDEDDEYYDLIRVASMCIEKSFIRAFKLFDLLFIFCVACRLGNTKVFKYCIKQGVFKKYIMDIIKYGDIETSIWTKKYCCNPLTWVIIGNQLKIIELFVKHPIEDFIVEDAITYAIEFGRLDILKYFIEKSKLKIIYTTVREDMRGKILEIPPFSPKCTTDYMKQIGAVHFERYLIWNPPEKFGFKWSSVWIMLKNFKNTD